MAQRIFRILMEGRAKVSFYLLLGRLILTSTVIMSILGLRALAQKPESPPHVVTGNCSGCHGIGGNAQLPYIPRLAGQRAAYLEQRLAYFREAATPPTDELLQRIVAPRRAHRGAGKSNNAATNMIGMAHAITLEESQAATVWYARQKATPGRAGNPELVAKGKAVFAKGLPAQHLPACQTCHGAQGEGTERAPHLAGQNGSYLLSRLAWFRAEDQPHGSVMTPIAQHLDHDQSRAIAAYLQSR